MKWLINYSDERFRQAQVVNSHTGLKNGNFDAVIQYGPHSIDDQFREKNTEIFESGRGAGYWIWKPYIIHKTLQRMEDGEYLFYCDSGAFFLESIDHLIADAERLKQKVIVFELEPMHLEKMWNKRDAFILLDCDKPEFTDTAQRIGGFSLWKKSPEAMEFVTTWLEAAQDPRLIMDKPNEMGQENYPEFRDHRHDQALLSLLSKKFGIRAHRDPSQYGQRREEDYPESTYPQLVYSGRKNTVKVYHDWLLDRPFPELYKD